jgi:hypothetical protein
MEKISVMKVITYSVENIRADLAITLEQQVSTITDEQIIQRAKDFAYEDFGSLEGLIIVDENGEQL